MPAPNDRLDPRWTVAGPSGAPLIVFIHPTRLNRTFWSPQVDALSRANRTLAVDLPGHGRLEGEPFTLPGAVDVVRAAIEAEAAASEPPVPTVVVGLSLGGYVAMALGAETPGIADTLVLAGSTAEPTGRRAGSFRALALAYDRTPRPVVRSINAAIFRRRYPGGMGDLLIRSGIASRGGAEALRTLAGHAFLPRLAAYPGRVVLVNGGRDLVMRPGERRFLAATGRRGRLVRLPGAYHLSSLDRPTEFTAVIQSAVDEVVEARRLGR